MSKPIISNNFNPLTIRNEVVVQPILTIRFPWYFSILSMLRCMFAIHALERRALSNTPRRLMLPCESAFVTNCWRCCSAGWFVCCLLEFWTVMKIHPIINNWWSFTNEDSERFSVCQVSSWRCSNHNALWLSVGCNVSSSLVVVDVVVVNPF